VGHALKINIVHQIVDGMVFLHEQKLKHLDLKATNILINNRFDAKVIFSYCFLF